MLIFKEIMNLFNIKYMMTIGSGLFTQRLLDEHLMIEEILAIKKKKETSKDNNFKQLRP